NNNQETLNSAKDVQGTAFTVVSPGAGYPQMAYAARGTQSTDQDNVLTMNLTDHGSGNMQFLLYDIAGAASPPFDVSAFQGPGSVTTGPATIADAPDLTPTPING